VDSYEWNKIAGWTLAGLLSILGLSVITGALFPSHAPEQPGYIVEGVEEEAVADASSGPAEQPIEFFLASANVQKGEAQFKKCAACHSIDKGAAPAIGPNLWGIVGNHHAHEAGFAYSDAMKATADKEWTWDALSQWIANPKKYIPGNKMAFAGMSKPQDRADLIAFLNSESDSPLPIPAPPAAEAAPEAAAEAAPADEATEAAAPETASAEEATTAA